MKPFHFLPLSLALAAFVAGADRPPEQQAAVDLFAQRRNPEAKAAFEKLAAANPSDAEAQQHLGLLALRAEDPKTAVRHLERAVALAPRNSVYQHQLGNAYGSRALKANVFSKASWAGRCRAAYETAIALDSSNVDARVSLIAYYQRAPGLLGGSMEKAYAHADEIVKLDPARGRAVKAGLLLADKRVPEALTLYEQSLTGGPGDYSALYAIGRVAATTGEGLDRGLETLRKCLTLPAPPDAPGHPAVHWRIGNIQEKRGDKPAARMSYEASLELDPKFVSAQKSLAGLK